MSEDAFESIKKIAKRLKSGTKLKQAIADKISEEYLETQLKEEFQINLEEVKNGFVASGYSLFDFIRLYFNLTNHNLRIQRHCFETHYQRYGTRQ